MNFFDAAKLVLAHIKDRVSEDNYNALVKSYMEYLKAEADMRRSKMACDIIRMNKLRIAVKKLEHDYSYVVGEIGRTPEIENMINSAKRDIKLISLNKNK